MNSEPNGKIKSEGQGIWRFGPSDTPVMIKNADALLPYLPYFLTGWNISWAGLSPTNEPDITIEEYSGGEYRIISYGVSAADLSFENPYDAANRLATELVRVHITRDLHTICLTASAVKIEEGLVVIVGDMFAKQSSIALHLSVLGHRFFGSDQIAISIGPRATGTCLGLMPKVHLPLPDDCGTAFREFVDGYSSMQNDEVAYLKLWDGEAADFGDAAPISALVFLDQKKDGHPAIERVLGSDLASKMASTVYAPHIGIADLLSGLSQLTEKIPSYKLRFTSGREAALLVSKEWNNSAAF